MILQALEKYYRILSNDENSGVAPIGYSKANVSFALNLSKSGDLLGIIPLKEKVTRGKKEIEVPKSMMVPEQIKRAAGVNSNFLCENSSYILGLDNKEKPERTKQCFEAFKDLHNNILKDIDCDEARAVLSFLEIWDIEKAAENNFIKDYLEEILKGGNMIFKLDGEFSYIHNNEKIKRAWEDYKNKNIEDAKMQCMITGKMSEIARLHPSIKGIRGAQASGASLVSFNATAYDSYGRDKQQGYNAPISSYAAFAYGTTLNYLLSNEKNRMNLGDTTVVFWAESVNPIYNQLAGLCFNPPEPPKDEKTETLVQDFSTEKIIFSCLKAISEGKPLDLPKEIDPDVNFYILGLSPNAARLSVRFFIRNSFGDFIKHISEHYENLKIQKNFANERDFIPIWMLLSETVSPKAKEKTASPLLAGAVMRSILTGTNYPEILYNTIMLRVKAERDVSYIKASVIKACLIKKIKGKNKEVLSLALNKESNNKAYVLGRLFAHLEKAQEEANGTSNIKARYFSSACSTPKSVFPILLKLSGHHINKAEYSTNLEIKIGEIINRINDTDNPFPAHLTLDEQGIFILGYYHQRRSFFTPKSVNREEK